MRSGFSILELLVATAIASLLAGALVFSFSQTNRAVTAVDDMIDIYSTAILVDTVFCKDVAGAFIPVQAIPAKKQQQPEQEEKEQKRPTLKDPFISENRADQLYMFSCITNNPTRIFWGKKSGDAKPSIARVVYTLEPDSSAPKDKPRFILYRQEGKELQLATYTAKDSAIERYPIAENVKSCALSFVLGIEPEDAQAQQGVEFKTFTDWRIGDDEKDVRSKMKLPHEVTMKLILWDDEQVGDKEFILSVAIVTGFQELPEPEKSVQPRQVPKEGQAPTEGQKPKTPAAPQERKELLVSRVNSVVENIRTVFGT